MLFPIFVLPTLPSGMCSCFSLLNPQWGGKAAAAQVNNAGFKATLTFERRAISE